MSSLKFQTINPATEKVIKNYQYYQLFQANEIISLCAKEQNNWVLKDIDYKLNLIQNFSDALVHSTDEVAALITEEIGKPISQSIVEVEKSLGLCQYYLSHAKEFLEPVIIKTEMHKSYYIYAALGIIFGIMPWNFPLWQVMRYAIPNLLVGNAIILKHAPNSTGISLKIEELFQQSGFNNLFRSLVLKTDDIQQVIANKNIAGVTITASKQAGIAVATQAGQNLKKTVLELGGNDPYIILADADLDLAVNEVIKSRLLNTGQVCIAAKRIIIVKEIKKKFEEKIIAAAKQYKYSSPNLPTAQLGPIARSDLLNTLRKQVKKSTRQGAKCIYQSDIPKDTGFYFPVTVLTDITTDNIAFNDEIFGPVISITEAVNETEAIKLANMSEFGLSAVVFTKNLKRGEEICNKELEFGTCNLNAMAVSDPRLPFGGIKNSGFGRELGKVAMREFVNIKTINIKAE